MIFNEEQFQALAKYEEHFKTAVEARWARYLGRDALTEIYTILKAATGDRRRLNPGCSVCNLNLVRDAGLLYFKDAQARIDAENDKKAVELTAKAAKTRKKVAIKTEEE